MTCEQAFDIALGCHRAGRLAEAEAMYRQVLAAEPNHAGAFHYLGKIALHAGHHDLAIQLLNRSLLLQPNDAAVHASLADAYRRMGRPNEAIDSLERAVEIQPRFLEALGILGAALAARNDHERAASVLRRAVEIDPRHAGNFSNLCLVLTALERWDEAIAAGQRAVEIDPRFAAGHYNLGIALLRRRRLDEAVAAFRSALQRDSSIAEFHDNLGNALAAQNQMEEAIDAYRQAISLQPDSQDFHWNAALALLSVGRFREGWEHYEWRVKLECLARPDLTAPPWNGEDLTDKTLLIHQEGGFGDAIHFMRYLPMIRARGVGRVVFQGEPAILPLMKLQAGIDETIPAGRPLPAHDFHCPPPSFPRIFGTELENIPAAVPYLLVDSEKAALWRRKLSGSPYRETGERPSFLVGICWAGSHLPTDRRSRTLHTFAPLAQVPGVTFVSLQKGPEARQAEGVPTGMRFVDAAAEVEDFSDLAALVSCLDAVVSVDTSVAHLAGALGVSTWILIPQSADFRWLIGRTDSPWYPTARLFRQQAGESWEEPVERMAEALRQRIESAPPASTSPR